jgi:hypothetical protein
MFGMGRHEEARARANDPFMTTVVGLLLVLLAAVCVLAGM